MTALLQNLQCAGVDLALVGGQLRARGALTKEARAFLKGHKAELIAELQAANAQLPPVTAKRWRTTTARGQVLEHHFPSGGTQADARQAGSEFGQVVKVEPLPEISMEPKPVSLDLALAMATAGLSITAKQFRAQLDPEDLADIKAGLISLKTLRGYAEHGGRLTPVAKDDDRIRCGDCANLISRECLAAKQLGLPGRYHPPGPELPRRCKAFAKRGQR